MKTHMLFTTAWTLREPIVHARYCVARCTAYLAPDCLRQTQSGHGGRRERQPRSLSIGYDWVGG